MPRILVPKSWCMSGMFALHCLSCHILFMPCIMFEEPFILFPICSLVVLRNFYRYYLGMTEKAHQAAAFLSWYFQTSLSEVRFALTKHPRRCLCICFHLTCFCYFSLTLKKQKNKNWGRRCGIFIFSFDSFSDIACLFS
jgi:hypothetical protein